VFKETKRQKPMPTDKVSLAPYSSNPLVRDILTYKAIAKMQGTYIEALPRWQDDAGRIHGEYKQASVSTGRLASANPNMTNIPARKRDDLSVDVDGSLIRHAFIAPKEVG
jgi:DNA polymerase-1